MATFATRSAEIPYVKTNLDRLVISYEDRDPELLQIEHHAVEIHNGRVTQDPLSIEREGFIIEESPSLVVASRLDELIRENALPRDDEPEVNRAYSDELLPLISELSGAREVFAQYGTIAVRFSSHSNNRSWLTTAAFAHMDFSPEQADALVFTTCDITGRKVAPFARHVIYQTWRVITEPPQDFPLALCDGRSTATADMVPMDFHGLAGSRNALVKSRVSRFNPAHRWFCFPDMTPSEVLIFKGYDSLEPDYMNAMHTSFRDTSVVDAVPRGSVECRFIALYD